MLTKSRLQDLFHSRTKAVEGEIVLSHEEFENVYAAILMEQGSAREDEAMEAAKYLINREEKLRRHYSGINLLERLQNHLSDEERNATVAIAEKKRLIEDALVYFRSVVMISESIGMAGTHAEKAARLRGLIELLNSAIMKLRNEQQESLLNNWDSFHWGYSDYPYKRMIEKCSDLERENKELKEAASDKIGMHKPQGDIPF